MTPVKILIMKFSFVALIPVVLFSSCLKQSIPDAMLNKGGGTATISYKISGNPISISVADADNLGPDSYPVLYCIKNQGYYSFDAVGNTGELTFTFNTDSLAVGTYRYAFSMFDSFVTEYNGVNEFVYAPSDSITVNITSYSKQHISGNFSGVLTPLITPSNVNNIFGQPSSVPITNGTFKDVLVLY
jgi:hypothetical protein